MASISSIPVDIWRVTQEYCNDNNINKLLQTCKEMFQTSGELKYITLKGNFAVQFYTNELIRNYILNLINNRNKQLSITISYNKFIPDVSALGYALILNITDVSALGHVHALDLYGCTCIRTCTYT